MELVNIYEEYKAISKELVKYIEKIILEKFEGFDKEEGINNLNVILKKLEELKLKADNLDITKENTSNINDLQYLIVSGLFLTSELIHFLNINELDRFKMRAINFINNYRRNQNLNNR